MKVGDHVIINGREALIVKDSSFYRVLDLKTCILYNTMYTTLEDLSINSKRL